MARTPASTHKSIDLPPLDIRAALGAVDDDTRTVELIFSTGADVVRFDWNTGKRYIERLSMDPKHVRLGRLNAGAPLLNSHSAYTLADQMGVVVDDSAAVDGKRGRAAVRFSKRSDVEPFYQDVRDKVIRNVSVGYRVYRFEETEPKGNALPVRLATDWEPYEVSLVSMPADVGAQVRGTKPVDTNPCVVVTRHQESHMNDEQRQDGLSDTLDESAAEEQRMALATEERREETQEPTATELATRAERERVEGILLACRAAKIPSSTYDKFIKDGTPLVDAQRQIFIELQKRRDPVPAPRQGGVGIEMGDDPFVHKRSGIENALLHRVNPEKFQLSDKGRDYRGMTMLDIAKAYLQARGLRVTDMSRMDIAGTALGLVSVRGGMHTTSDFPLLLADVANKSLRADYEAAPQTFMDIVRIGSVPDFKTANRVQIGDAPSLKPVGEHGEFTRGTIEEGREQVQAASYGRVFGITRTSLVNDDLDAFSRVPAKFGRMARTLESDLVWYQILKNANMSDSNALFSAAHANYAGAGDIGITAISAAERAMLLQTGLDASTLIAAAPKFLIVPPSKKTQALQFVSTTLQASSIDNVNPFAGQLKVICEPRLETGITIGTLSATGSAYAWYLAADKNQVDIVELVYLEGQSGPVIESRVGFDIDGLEIKCRLDVGAKVIDWRGLYKSDGSDNS
jgi:hypothetical protein